MKATLHTIAYTLLIGTIVLLLLRKPEPLSPDISALVYQNKTLRTEANRLRIVAENIRSIRDTVYVDRIYTATRWRERIVEASPDSVVFYRLDSCMDIGSKVLHELELCDAEKDTVRKENDVLRLANSQSDTTINTLVAENSRLEKRLNKEIGRKKGWRLTAIISLLEKAGRSLLR